MPISGAAAALIGAGGSIFSGGLSGAMNMFANRRANKRMVDFWKMQNEYNHPSAQMARLREAGLNPNMIYGTSPTSAVGNADPLKPVPPERYDFDNPLENITAFADVRQRQAQTNNLETQNTVLANEAALKGVQAANLVEVGKKTKAEAKVAEELTQTSLQAAKENLKQQEQKAIGAELDVRFKDQTLKSRVLDIMYRAQNSAEMLKGNKLLNELRQYEIELKDLGIERGDNMFFRILGRLFNDELRELQNKF